MCVNDIIIPCKWFLPNTFIKILLRKKLYQDISPVVLQVDTLFAVSTIISSATVTIFEDVLMESSPKVKQRLGVSFLTS